MNEEAQKWTLSREAERLWDESRASVARVLAVIPDEAWDTWCNCVQERLQEFVAATDLFHKGWPPRQYLAAPSLSEDVTEKKNQISRDVTYNEFRTTFLFPPLWGSKKLLLAIAALHAEHLTNIVNMRGVSEKLIREGEIVHVKLARMINSEVIPLLSAVEKEIVREHYLKVHFGASESPVSES